MSAKTIPGTGTNPELAFKIDHNGQPVFRGRAYSTADRRIRVRLEEGFDTVLLVGEAGSGRTTLLSALAADLGSTQPVLHFERSPLNRLEALGRWGEIAAAAEVSRHIVVIIDDADQLPVEMLVAAHDARLAEDGVRVQFVLGAKPSSSERLLGVATSLDDAMAFCGLGWLDEDEVAPFVVHRLSTAGVDPGLFTREAAAQVAIYASGCPRLVNLICAKACFVAQLNHEARVSASSVEEAAFVLRISALPAARESVDPDGAEESRSAA